jgi:hypothetical protein
MTTDLTHAVGFLQTAYTILLALAFGEAFKQFVAERGDIQWTRLPSLLAFLFMIFPFFHGMSRYLYTTYLQHPGSLSQYAGYLMGDGITFMILSSLFFVLSRSLSPNHWRRFYGALLLLLLFDSIWICVALYRGIGPVKPWLAFNIILGAILICVLLFNRRQESIAPPVICAIATFSTTALSYYVMRDFYFP